TCTCTGRPAGTGPSPAIRPASCLGRRRGSAGSPCPTRRGAQGRRGRSGGSCSPSSIRPRCRWRTATLHGLRCWPHRTSGASSGGPRGGAGRVVGIGQDRGGRGRLEQERLVLALQALPLVGRPARPRGGPPATPLRVRAPQRLVRLHRFGVAGAALHGHAVEPARRAGQVARLAGGGVAVPDLDPFDGHSGVSSGAGWESGGG